MKCKLTIFVITILERAVVLKNVLKFDKLILSVFSENMRHNYRIDLLKKHSSQKTTVCNSGFYRQEDIFKGFVKIYG